MLALSALGWSTLFAFDHFKSYIGSETRKFRPEQTFFPIGLIFDLQKLK